MKKHIYLGMAAALGLSLAMSSCSDDDSISAEEIAQIVKENTLSAEDIQKMIAEQTLTADQIAELIKANGITEEELQAAIEAAKAYTDTTYHEVALEDIPEYLYSWQYGKVAYIKPTGVTEDNIQSLFDCFKDSDVNGFLDLSDCKINTISGSINSYDYTYKIAGLVFPKTLKSLADDFADGNTTLSSVTLYGNIEEIPDYAFSYCKKLKSVTLSEGILSINYDAFCRTGITSVTIPASVTNIEEGAFAYCSNLNEVTFLATSLPEGFAVSSDMLYDIEDNVTIQVKCDAMGEYLKDVNSDWTVKNGDKEYTVKGDDEGK